MRNVDLYVGKTNAPSHSVLTFGAGSRSKPTWRQVQTFGRTLGISTSWGCFLNIQKSKESDAVLIFSVSVLLRGCYQTGCSQLSQLILEAGRESAESTLRLVEIRAAAMCSLGRSGGETEGVCCCRCNGGFGSLQAACSLYCSHCWTV